MTKLYFVSQLSRKLSISSFMKKRKRTIPHYYIDLGQILDTCKRADSENLQMRLDSNIWCHCILSGFFSGQKSFCFFAQDQNKEYSSRNAKSIKVDALALNAFSHVWLFKTNNGGWNTANLLHSVGDQTDVGPTTQDHTELLHHTQRHYTLHRDTTPYTEPLHRAAATAKSIKSQDWIKWRKIAQEKCEQICYANRVVYTIISMHLILKNIILNLLWL